LPLPVASLLLARICVVAALEEADAAVRSRSQSWDARSVILKWAPLLWKRNIPWTIVFGNHDDEETDLKHEQQMGSSSPSRPL